MQEVLTRLLRQAFDQGRIKAYYHPRGAPLVSNLMYVDDLLIFANGKKRSIESCTLGKYGSWSGQVINTDKSALFMSRKISY